MNKIVRVCEEVAAEIRRNGGNALPFIADVYDPVAVQAMAENATHEFGDIDTLIQNTAV